MEKHTALRFSRHHGSLAPVLQNAATKLRGWWRKRQSAKVLAALSAEQMRDCGIELTQHNVPTIEVPRGLMQRLQSPHMMG